MQTLNQLKIGNIVYDLAAKYDSEGSNIKDTYFKKAEMPQIEQAVTGAENVNATITEENIFEVTDRTGIKKTLDLNVTGGTSAGFGKIAATVDNSTGTPSVTVTTSGTNEAKNFTFAFTGLKGEQGTQGIQGAKGDTGSQGERGLQGERGEKGDMGSIGRISISVDNTTGTPSATATASKASDGSTDISFSFNGIKGEKGEKGERGEQGLQGERGEQGLPGNDGAKGDKGDKGDAFKYSDFTEEQLAALKGPKGDKGETGPVGPQGPKGDPGEKGEQGIQGVKGDQFTYEDFTPDEITNLKKPATDAANELNKYLDIVKLPVVETPVSETTVAMDANKVYDITIGESLTITINEPTDLTVTNEYQGSFDTGATAPTVIFPSNVIWAETPSVEANKHYEFNIRYTGGKYYGLVQAWSINTEEESV